MKHPWQQPLTNKRMIMSWILQVTIEKNIFKHMNQIVKQRGCILFCALLLPVMSPGDLQAENTIEEKVQNQNVIMQESIAGNETGGIIQPQNLLTQKLADGSAVLETTQPQDLLAEPEIVKVEPANRASFERRFRDVLWTGAGFRGSTVVDRIPTREIRARLQQVYGDPTQKLKHLIDEDNFRPGHYIQFEYWFVINDEIPMMVLDIDGPFGNGLVFAGASRYVDLMPEIKRTLTRKLMEVNELGEYEDHYFEMYSRQWYLVRYRDGNFQNDKVGRPGNLR